jgi:hypothetical protein
VHRDGGAGGSGSGGRRNCEENDGTFFSRENWFSFLAADGKCFFRLRVRLCPFWLAAAAAAGELVIEVATLDFLFLFSKSLLV